MPEEFFAMMVVFSTPVAIIAIVCTYKLMKQYLETKTGYVRPPRRLPSMPSSESVDEMRLRAAEMEHRLRNLEEIIASEASRQEAAS